MNQLNKWLSKKYGFHFVIPNRYDSINVLIGIVIGIIICWIVSNALGDE